MAANNHRTRVYYTYEQFAAACTDERYARKVWKRHTERNGNVPLVQECSICSGAEERLEVKRGRGKPRAKRRRDLNGYED